MGMEVGARVGLPVGLEVRRCTDESAVVTVGSVVDGGCDGEHSLSSPLSAVGCTVLTGDIAAADTRCKVAFTTMPF